MKRLLCATFLASVAMPAFAQNRALSIQLYRVGPPGEFAAMTVLRSLAGTLFADGTLDTLTVTNYGLEDGATVCLQLGKYVGSDKLNAVKARLEAIRPDGQGLTYEINQVSSCVVE